VFADRLREAHLLARRAMEAWAEAQAAGDTGVGGADPWAVAPGAPDGEARDRARSLLHLARESALSAEAELVGVLHRAAESAPQRPQKQGLLSKLAGAAGDMGSAIGRGALDVGADIGNAVASVANAMGRHPEDALALAAGLALMTASAGGEAVGLAVDATVVGAPVGVAINAVSAGTFLAGAGMTVAAMGEIGEHAAGDSSVQPLSRGGGGSQASKTREFDSKQTARESFEGEIRSAANRFFRGATSKSQDFRATELEHGGYRFEFFSPANNPGYGKLYVQEIDRSGAVVREFKNTMGPHGLIETKWVHGGP
jgi:hypothetical protein